MDHKYPSLPSLGDLGLTPKPARLSGENLPKMGKFRFQLLADWIASNLQPCRVADVGGGKGLLAYFLNSKGFDAEVIDPVFQTLPERVRDCHSKEKIRFTATDEPRHLSEPFSVALAEQYELMVALHAHGSNLAMIEAAAKYKRACVLLPCCVIDEPLAPPVGENWFRWLSGKAEAAGLQVEYFSLNFKGQNLGMWCRSQ